MKISNRIAFLALCCVTIIATTTQASPFDVETKITAVDAAANDFFGRSVAISGNTAIVGAYGNDDGGNASGSAYLFDVTTGSQLAKLTASDAATLDRFGYSVANSGNTAIVGAYTDDHGSVDSGSAYLFDVTTGNLITKLTASDAAESDKFGWSVAISGNTAIVGAYFDEDGGRESGSAYLFDVTTGNQLAKLNASDAAELDRFGYSVAIDGNIALVGARGLGLGGSASNIHGSAYLFDVTTGNQLAKLDALDVPSTYSEFGYSVAISGNTALVGARGGSNTAGATGSAYLFDVTTGNQFAKLIASDGATNDRFGRAVAISGNTVIVGAYGDDDDGFSSGSAYLFDAITGNQLSKITASDAAGFNEFGFSVAINGNTAIVGAHKNGGTGAAYLLSNSGGAPSADFNADQDVDSADLAIWESAFGNNALGDADGDSDTDGADFLVWQRQFNSATATGVAIPEPNTLLLSVFSCVGFLLRQNR